jgi:ribosome-binding protein aMBF1 (putative translation factor)
LLHQALNFVNEYVVENQRPDDGGHAEVSVLRPMTENKDGECRKGDGDARARDFSASSLRNRHLLSTFVDSHLPTIVGISPGMQASEAKLLKTFGRSIRRVRKQRGLTQEDLAEVAKMSRNYISDIERGVRNPGLLVMVALAKALKVSLRELVEEIEPRR